jgi:hypothetical protein
VRGAWKEAGLRLSNAVGEEVFVGVASEPEALQLVVDRRVPGGRRFTRPMRSGTRPPCAGAVPEPTA